MQRVLRLFALVAATVMSGAAHAADLPVLKAPPSVAPAYNWTGFYVGAHGGAAWADNKFVDVLGATFTAQGGFGGGQIGYNWQTGPWVFGAEAEGSLSRIRRGVFGFGGFGGGGLGGGFCQFGGFGGFGGLGGGCCQTGFGGGFGGFGGGFCQFGARIHAIGLISGRLGYAWDRYLLYVKGGGAVADETYVVRVPDVLSAQPDDTRFGWIVGAGIEWAVSSNWSAKVEYNYIDLGTERITVSGGGLTVVVDHQQQVHLLKFGVNYRFGSNIVGARY
jgi:outer membrane immunogenic protein